MADESVAESKAESAVSVRSTLHAAFNRSDSRSGKVPPYKGTNWRTFETLVTSFLKVRGLWGVVSKPVPANAAGKVLRERVGDTNPSAVSVEEFDNGKSNDPVMDSLVMSVQAWEHLLTALAPCEELLSQLVTTVECGNAYALWKALKARQKEQAGPNKIRLIQLLGTVVQKPEETASEYMQRLQQYRQELLAIGATYDEDMVKIRFFSTLQPKWKHIGATLSYENFKGAMTIDKIISTAAEMAAVMGTVSNAVPTADKQPGGGQKKTTTVANAVSSEGAETRTCFRCHKPGHLSADCTSQMHHSGAKPKERKWCGFCRFKGGHSTEECNKKKAAEAGKQGSTSSKFAPDQKAKQANGNSVNVTWGCNASTNDPAQSGWMLDSGASEHMGKSHMVQGNKPWKGSIRVATGAALG